MPTINKPKYMSICFVSIVDVSNIFVNDENIDDSSELD